MDGHLSPGDGNICSQISPESSDDISDDNVIILGKVHLTFMTMENPDI